MDKQDFNQLVELAMSRPGLGAMRPVVEKEILHYDIFHVLNVCGFLKDLVFQGGTSLRLCRGSKRFSEDLDFAGGRDFSPERMRKLTESIEEHIGHRYGLKVTVKEPKAGRDSSDPENIRVDRWQVSVETSPGRRDLPQQRVKLEIANVPAHTRELAPLRSNYDFLPGYNAILVPCETMGEVMADKVLAFPASVKNIRHRDIWDLAWLTQQGVKLDPALVLKKIKDYGVQDYPELLNSAIERLPEIAMSKAFKDQMSRFIDADSFKANLGNDLFLEYLSNTVGDLFQDMKAAMAPAPAIALAPLAFKM